MIMNSKEKDIIFTIDEDLKNRNTIQLKKIKPS